MTISWPVVGAGAAAGAAWTLAAGACAFASAGGAFESLGGGAG